MAEIICHQRTYITLPYGLAFFVSFEAQCAYFEVSCFILPCGLHRTSENLGVWEAGLKPVFSLPIALAGQTRRGYTATPLQSEFCTYLHGKVGAGWSSPVARQAHNLKVVGSNPTPAPNFSGLFIPSYCLLLAGLVFLRRLRRRRFGLPA